MKSKIKLFITITYILIFKENDEIYRFYFCQKNKFSDSDENRIGWEGYLWHELKVPTLAIDFGLDKFSNQRVSH